MRPAREEGRAPLGGLAQRINDAAIARQGGTSGRALRLARRALLRVTDPEITAEVGGRTLRMPLSHELPHYLRTHPRYSRNIGTLARVTHEAGLPDVLVDVGANIGDTVAFVLEQVPEMRILCIDADVRFVELLRRNTAGLAGVHTVGPVLLADSSEGVDGAVQSVEGTARVVATTEHLPSTTLDDVLAGEPGFESATILKSDTDGFEAKVLAGAVGFLERAQPILHLEYDPRLLAEAGSDGASLLAWLASLGYERAVVYDNLGSPLTTCGIVDPMMRDLDRHAIGRERYYYDLVIAPAATADVVTSLAAVEGLA